MGPVGGRRFSVSDFHAAPKTSSANGSHLNVWDFDKSAAGFPQQKKRAFLVWIGPDGFLRFVTQEKMNNYVQVSRKWGYVDKRRTT